MILSSMWEFIDAFGPPRDARSEFSGGSYTRQGGAVLDRPETELDDGGSPPVGTWFCIRREPFTCGGCNAKVEFFDDSRHRIVVYPSEGDPNMIWKVNEMNEEGKSPEVVEYERALGDAVSFYELCPS